MFLKLHLSRRSPHRPWWWAASQQAQRLFLVKGSCPPLGRPFFFLLAAHCATPARACALARARTEHGRQRTNERCDVRSAGVADWITAARRTTGEYGAYAHRCGGPLSSRPLSPRPYNAAAPKGPAFGFLNYYDKPIVQRDMELGGASRKTAGDRQRGFVGGAIARIRLPRCFCP